MTNEIEKLKNIIKTKEQSYKTLKAKYLKIDKELQKKDLLIKASQELVKAQRQRIAEIEKLLAKQKVLTDKQVAVSMEAFNSCSSFMWIERELTAKMNKELKANGLLD
jgi:SMC interacting uncharacterized protein involved in chromosome segregation